MKADDHNVPNLVQKGQEEQVEESLRAMLLFNQKERSAGFIHLVRATVLETLQHQCSAAIESPETDAQTFGKILYAVESQINGFGRKLAEYIPNADINDIVTIVHDGIDAAATAVNLGENEVFKSEQVASAIQAVQESLMALRRNFHAAMLTSEDEYVAELLIERVGNHDPTQPLNPRSFVKPLEEVGPRLHFQEGDMNHEFWEMLMNKVSMKQSDVKEEELETREEDVHVRGQRGVPMMKVMTGAEIEKHRKKFVEFVRKNAEEIEKKLRGRIELGQSVEEFLAQEEKLANEQFDRYVHTIEPTQVRWDKEVEGMQKRPEDKASRIYDEQLTKKTGPWLVQLFENVPVATFSGLDGLRMEKYKKQLCFFVCDDVFPKSDLENIQKDIGSFEYLRTLSDTYILQVIPEKTERAAILKEREKIYMLITKEVERMGTDQQKPIRSYAELREYFHSVYNVLTIAIQEMDLEGSDKQIHILKEVFCFILKERLAVGFLETQILYPRLAAPDTIDQSEDFLVQALVNTPQEDDVLEYSQDALDQSKKVSSILSSTFLSTWWQHTWEDFFQRHTVENRPLEEKRDESAIVGVACHDFRKNVQSQFDEAMLVEALRNPQEFDELIDRLKDTLSTLPVSVPLAKETWSVPSDAWQQYFADRINELEEHLRPLIENAHQEEEERIGALRKELIVGLTRID